MPENKPKPPSLSDVQKMAAAAQKAAAAAKQPAPAVEPFYKSWGKTRTTTDFQNPIDYLLYGPWDNAAYRGSYKPTTTTYTGTGRPIGGVTGQAESASAPTYAPTYAPAAGAPLSLAEVAQRRSAIPDLSPSGVAPAPGAATPGNVNIAPLGARAREQALAERLGMEYIPGQAAGTAQAAYDQQQLRNQIEGNYSGASQSIANQIAAAQDRYGKNQADIKNIFGTLSTIRAADKTKIAQQFANSIQAAQDRADAMTAQAQQQLQLGQQGAATAGAELGGGPAQMPTDSLTSQAVAQGIADQNANQGTWDRLMQGMGLQQQGNVDTAVQGYNLQQAGALDALRRGYEESMLGLEGQQLSLQDQIAQAMSGAQAAQAGAQSDWALQQLKNQGALDVAQTRAAARGSSGGGGNATTTNKLKTVSDVFAAAAAQGTSPQYIINNANNAIMGASAGLNQGNDGTKGLKTPTAAQALAQWNLASANSKNFAAIAPLVTAYIQATLK